MITADESGYLKKVEIQTGVVLKKWGPGKPIVSIASEGDLVIAINEEAHLTVLDTNLSELRAVDLTLTNSRPIKGLLVDGRIVVAYANGVIGQVDTELVKQQLISHTNCKLNAVSLRGNRLLCLWSG